MTAALERLPSPAAVLDAAGGDPYARVSVRGDAVGWRRDHAVGWVGVDGEERVTYFTALGSGDAVAALAAAVWDELPGSPRMTLPRGTAPRLADVGLAMVPPTDWDYRWLVSPPAVQPGEKAVGWLADAAEVPALLAEASPTASARPGDPHVVRWCGIRAPSGQLLAVAADTSPTAAEGMLASIAVHPAARGRGLGAAVTGWLVRQLFAGGATLVGLGMYADNAAGRRLYDRLGMADDHRFTSGPVRRVP